MILFVLIQNHPRPMVSRACLVPSHSFHVLDEAVKLPLGQIRELTSDGCVGVYEMPEQGSARASENLEEDRRHDQQGKHRVGIV